MHTGRVNSKGILIEELICSVQKDWFVTTNNVDIDDENSTFIQKGLITCLPCLHGLWSLLVGCRIEQVSQYL